MTDGAGQMVPMTLLQHGSVSVIDYRCSAGPADRPFVEAHGGFCLSYVRKGSFGYRARGRSFELVAGSVLVGYPGDEYICTHEYSCGDECLSIELAPSFVDTLGAQIGIWRIGCVPPLPELMVLGELAQATVEDSGGLGLDEAAVLFSARFVEIVSGQRWEQLGSGHATVAVRWRRRCGSTRIPASRSIWKARRQRRGSALSIFYGSLGTFSA